MKKEQLNKVKEELIASVDDLMRQMANHYHSRCSWITSEDFYQSAYLKLWKRTDDFILSEKIIKSSYTTFAFQNIRFAIQETLCEYQSVYIGYTNTKIILKTLKLLESGLSLDEIAKKLDVRKSRLVNLLLLIAPDKSPVSNSTDNTGVLGDYKKNIPSNSHNPSNREKYLYDILRKDFMLSEKEINNIFGYIYKTHEVRRCDFLNICIKIRKTVDTKPLLAEILQDFFN